MSRKICVITSGRADYGLLRGVMRGINNDSDLKLQVIAAGSHLSMGLGATYTTIEADGFVIDKKVPSIIGDDSSLGIAQSMGLAIAGFAEALASLSPDIVLVLGDRYEIFSAVAAALVARMPVAHIHGGELTLGAYDDALRHCITKMSHLHFVAAESYKQRVIQLGESPQAVFMVGGLGVDSILQEPPLSRTELEAALDFTLGHRNLLITFHPTTLSAESATAQISQLLTALDRLSDTHFIFTTPNADNGGGEIFHQLEEFIQGKTHCKIYHYLGPQRYYACLRHCDAIVGNSSSGILEAPSFKIPTVNIGTRQEGRLRAGSIIDCEATSDSIGAALELAYSQKFQSQLKEVKNPYGEGGATPKIIEVLRDYPLNNITSKQFFDWVSI